MTTKTSGVEPDAFQSWFVYLIRTRDNSLYCGVTTDVDRRFTEHQSNGTKAAKYLRGKQPLTLVWTYEATSKQQAMSLEWKIKRLSKRNKELLCKDDDRIKVLLNDN